MGEPAAKLSITVLSALVALSCSCGNLPEACEGSNVGDPACVEALEAYCGSEAEEDSCGDRSDVQVNAVTVRCVWGHTATITDAASCAMTPGGRCYAVPINRDGPTCEEFCDPTAGNDGYLILYDGVLVRLPCASDVNNWMAPLRADPVDAIGCRVDDETPESPACACAAAACDILG